MKNYRKGQVVMNMEWLVHGVRQKSLFFWNGRPLNSSFISNLPLHVIMKAVDDGRLYFAERIR